MSRREETTREKKTRRYHYETFHHKERKIRTLQRKFVSGGKWIINAGERPVRHEEDAAQRTGSVPERREGKKKKRF